MLAVDMDGRIQQFNQAYRKMLGYESDELRKLTYMDLTPEKWHDFETGIIEKQVLPRGYSDIYEKEYIRKDGTVFPVELRTVLMRDEAGNPSGMWAIVRDISERKIIEQTLRESEARYRELLENSMQGRDRIPGYAGCICKSGHDGSAWLYPGRIKIAYTG